MDASASFDPTSDDATDAILHSGTMAFMDVKRCAASLLLASDRVARVASAAALRRSDRGEDRKDMSS